MFYEFNGYAYYALIQAATIEEAKGLYEEVVCDIEGDDAEKEPDLLTKEQVLERIAKSKFDDEIDRQHAVSEIENGESMVILIDAALI